MKKRILHIAAHLGGGAGKAISGLAIGLNEEFENEILLLEQPEQERYVNLCEENAIKVNISSDVNEIMAYIQRADYVIFSWWGHPLSLEVYKALEEVEAIVFLWSHVNGLYYPYISPKFVELFDGAFFTSACTYENDTWSLDERKKIEQFSETIFGIGLFRPSNIQSKENYKVSENIVIGYSGTINYAKMNAEFPRVCSKIRKRIPNVIFKLYGLYDEDVYKSFIEFDNELKDVLVFEGFVDDIESKLSKLDIYCYPLNKENFATTENALLEAMAVGLPIVVLNNPAERNIITHKVDGFIAENIEEMVEYVVEISQNIEVARLLGENARKKVIETYDYKVNASKCMAYINMFEAHKKRKHNFLSVVGDCAAQNYLFFSQMTRDEYEEKARCGNLLEILKGSTKGSLNHYLKYYDDPMLNFLKQIEC